MRICSLIAASVGGSIEAKDFRYQPPEPAPEHAAELDPMVVALKKALMNRPGNPAPASTPAAKLETP